MKIKLLVLAAAISPAMATFGQTVAKKTFLYNQGKMAVIGTSSTNTALYIQGDFVAGSKDGATSTDPGTTSDILVKNSRTVLTGDFKHNANLSGRSNTVFNSASTADGIFEFRGDAVQNITTDYTTFAEIPNKGDSYINFPTLEINNENTVIIDPALAAKTADLTLTKGTFILDAVRIDDSNKSRYFSDNIVESGSVNPDERSVLAHLQVTGDATYPNMATAATPAERGFVRVIVPFDESGLYDATRYGSIVGMGIPFQSLKADYFTWNYLLMPNPNNYFGPNNAPITDPNTELKPGVGYIIGNELRGTAWADYNVDNYATLPTDGWASGSETMFNARFKDGYTFDRSLFETNPNNLGGTYADKKSTVNYTGEKINNSDVVVQLQPGYNYIANPFTTPLDISALLEDNTSSTPNADWKVVSGSNADTRDILNRVWVMTGSSKGSGKFNMLNPGGPDITGKRLQVQVSFYQAGGTGSTYIEADNSTRTLIPALQMFVVYAQKATSITIPKAAQAMGTNTFIRSNIAPVNDFAFEVFDKKTKTADRTSVVLRPKSELISSAAYSNVVKPNTAVDTDVKTAGTAALSQGVFSQLYTVSDSGNPLGVKYLGYTPNVDSKISTPLYLKPSNIDQEVVIKGFRLESLNDFESVILVDKLLGKETELTPETEYTTTVKSTDSDDRFVLIFSRGTDGIEDEIQESSKSINSYYANGTLTVTGFDESDFGSSLSVYDMQGRQVAQTRVNDFTVNVPANYAPGAFIVKVVGNNSYVAKFLVK